MFNKRKCRQCAYSMSLTENTKICGYCLIMHTTCLQLTDNFEIVDIRGSDPNKCRLYKDRESDRNGRLY